MSSTPIYDELAATYLADLTPDPEQPAGPDDPAGRPGRPGAAQAPPRTQPRKRPKV